MNIITALEARQLNEGALKNKLLNNIYDITPEEKQYLNDIFKCLYQDLVSIENLHHHELFGFDTTRYPNIIKILRNLGYVVHIAGNEGKIMLDW